MGSPAAGSGGRQRLGIDLGGTKIAGIVLGRDGSTLAEARVAAPRGAYGETVEAVADLVLRLEAEVGMPCSVGIGMPGSLSPATGLVRNANSHWLNGHPFAADLEQRLERPLRIENDANCLAVSEAIDGAGAGARVVWAVILGTGVGSGIALDGRVLTGRNGIAGEWGHGPLPAPRRRATGSRLLLRPPGLRRDLAVRARDGGGPRSAARRQPHRGGRRRRGPDRQSGGAGDAGRASRAARARGRPGGEPAGPGCDRDRRRPVADPGADRRPAGRDRPHVFSDTFDTPVRASLHGDASGVRGAAWLWEAEGA